MDDAGDPDDTVLPVTNKRHDPPADDPSDSDSDVIYRPSGSKKKAQYPPAPEILPLDADDDVQPPTLVGQATAGLSLLGAGPATSNRQTKVVSFQGIAGRPAPSLLGQSPGSGPLVRVRYAHPVAIVQPIRDLGMRSALLDQYILISTLTKADHERYRWLMAAQKQRPLTKVM